MSYLYEEILDGLTKIPVYGSPGLMVISNDKAQAVFTGESAGEVFLAAAKYGNGKLFVCGHDKYYYWLDGDEDRNEVVDAFMYNVKKWLTNLDDVTDLEILDVDEVDINEFDFDRYKLIKWCQDAYVDETMQQFLLDYIKLGGALFIAVTPWGYLQLNPDSTLHDLCAHEFLKKNFDIVFTESSLTLDSEIDVVKNMARYSSFTKAVDKVTHDSKKITKYCSTIQYGLGVLKKEGIIDDNFIEYLEDTIKTEINNNKMNPYPLNERCIKKLEEKNLLKLHCKCLLEKDCETKAPYIDEFPGDFKELPPLLIDVLVNVEAKFDEWVSTGYYLPAGVMMNVCVVDGNIEDWSVRIGAHDDDLSSCDELRRWPIVSITKRVEAQFTICSPFGGLVYFESSKESRLTVSVSNVVESPYVDILKPDTITKWSRSRINAPGLWAEVAGEHVILTCPSSCIRDLKEPLEVTKFWDNVIKWHHKLRGTDPYKYKRERIVNDKQPKAGYMHSGYPIVTHLDICEASYNECMFDINKLNKDGCWGLFHELGHNMQRDEWTFDGATEVTVNIFSMHAMEFIIGKKVLEQTWIKNQKHLFKKYFKQQPTYDDWQSNCCIAIMTFAQLIKHFGWDPMYKFLSDYEKDIQNGADSLPRDNQEKIDQWVIRYSKIIKHNIKPQFELWGLPVSDSVNEILHQLPEWCPKNETDTDAFYR